MPTSVVWRRDTQHASALHTPRSRYVREVCPWRRFGAADPRGRAASRSASLSRSRRRLPPHDLLLDGRSPLEPLSPVFNDPWHDLRELDEDRRLLAAALSRFEATPELHQRPVTGPTSTEFCSPRLSHGTLQNRLAS